VLAFITKRAIFPFSSWLPIAIAAPTPISALVHSSTLVTSGLFLLIRFSYIIYSSSDVLVFLLVLSVFTSLYAGLNSVFEVDIKKLIALSTLSHLGFIGMAFSCGILYLSFFHLLVHALFKSLLFMAIGDIIRNLFHSQDIRFLSFGVAYTPASFYIIMVRLLNLLGMPMLSGYFSKDLVLEACNFSHISHFMVSLIYVNVFFTYFYTYRLFRFSFMATRFSSYVTISSRSTIHVFLLVLLGLIGVVFGFV
jgi:NADH-ubiquinone oxidoreductase chain 5